MIKRKYLIIAFLAFCLTATLFITIATSEKKETPWTPISELQERVDSLNASLIELQNRVNTIEEEANQVKTIRFFEPNETFTNQYNVWIEAAHFTWIPQNNTNNAILSISCYFEYKTDVEEEYDIMGSVRILCNDRRTGEELHFYGFTSWTQSPLWNVPSIPILAMLEGLPVNAASYTLVFEIQPQKFSTPEIYVRNINIILTVADGLPAES